ncbi:MAG: TolC family protein [Nitrospirota bacterium]|nr:TolC family protein [Nitrospirota bacterium]MDE3034534.1 TolC family protein [Nitrospirota bacterium]MDE3225578.1 TolC family protein [Nitrospirota bacterium]MDE3243007.1 TolC family protein [Nitrospirota bacterium]
MVVRAYLLALALSLLGAGSASAAASEPAPQPELRLSLHDAIEAALDNNPKVRMLKEQIQTAQGIADTSRGALLPNLSGFVNQRNQTVNLATFGIPSDKLSSLGIGSGGVTAPFNVFDARATIVQNLFSLSLLQRWHAARTGVDVASLEAEITRRDTMATVALLYMEALRAEAAVKAGEANVELGQRLLKLAQDRKKAGVATGLDVTREQVHLENEKQRLLVAQSDRDGSKLNLIRVLGIDFDIRLTLTDELKLVEIEGRHAHEILASARENRVELKAQATREKLAALSLSSITSERLPSLNFNGDYGWIGLKADDAIGTRTVGVTLSVPILDGGQREGRISEGRSKVRQESIRMKDVSDQVTLEVRNALITLVSSRQQVSVAEEGLKLAHKELEQAQDRFAAGVANNIEVTNAQTSVARARDNVIEALFRFNASRVNLARAEGQLETLY